MNRARAQRSKRSLFKHFLINSQAGVLWFVRSARSIMMARILNLEF
jgi:hypothetical protein